MARLLATEAAQMAVDRAMKAVLATDPSRTDTMMGWWHEARLGDLWLGPASVERRIIAESLQRI
jgi:alkylation response protein AidB-like acyl-CoA dehydrogenase